MEHDSAFLLTHPDRAPHRRTTEHSRDDWRTPRDLYDSLRARFTFTGDVCASAENALEDLFFTEGESALLGDWSKLGDSVYMNPPYSQVSQFTARARRAVADGEVTTAVALVPSTPDVQWFHEHALDAAAEIWFFRGRISFVGADSGHAVSGNPVGSCLVVWAGTCGWAGPRVGSLCSKKYTPLTPSDMAYWAQTSKGTRRQLNLF